MTAQAILLRLLTERLLDGANLTDREKDALYAACGLTKSVIQEQAYKKSAMLKVGNYIHYLMDCEADSEALVKEIAEMRVTINSLRERLGDVPGIAYRDYIPLSVQRIPVSVAAIDDKERNFARRMMAGFLKVTYMGELAALFATDFPRAGDRGIAKRMLARYGMTFVPGSRRKKIWVRE